MANRKRRMKAVVLFTVVFFSGAILGGGLVAWRYFKMFKQQYYAGILSNARIGWYEAGKRKSKAFPQWIRKRC